MKNKNFNAMNGINENNEMVYIFDKPSYKDCTNILKKYQNKYNKAYQRITKNIEKVFKDNNYEEYIKIRKEFQDLMLKITKEVIDEFSFFKDLPVTILINGSLARGSNTIFSDLDLTISYPDILKAKLQPVEELLSYILYNIFGYKGRDKIHNIFVYLERPNVDYPFLEKNQFTITFKDNNKLNYQCRKNATEIMKDMFNSPREFNKLENYLLSKEKTGFNEWVNNFYIIMDNPQNMDKFYHDLEIVLENLNGDLEYLNNINHHLKSMNFKAFDLNTFKNQMEVPIFKKNIKNIPLKNTYEILTILNRLNYYYNNKITAFSIEDFKKDVFYKSFNHTNLVIDNFEKYLFCISKIQYVFSLLNVNFSCQTNEKTDMNQIKDKWNEIYGTNMNEYINNHINALYKSLNNLKDEISERIS